MSSEPTPSEAGSSRRASSDYSDYDYDLDDVSLPSPAPVTDRRVVPLDSIDKQTGMLLVGDKQCKPDSAATIKTESTVSQADTDAAYAANLPTLRYVAISFFVMFCAFQTTQTMVTSMFTDVGNLSLAVMYSFYSIMCLLGPSIVEKVGIKKTICACGIGYVTWVLATIPGSSGLFVFASAIVGSAAGPIWIAQGVFMSNLSKGKDTGRYNSAFLSIFFLSVCGGNLITGLMFLATSSSSSAPSSIAPSTAPLSGVPVAAAASGTRPPTLMLFALTAICAAGCAMLFFMPEAEKTADEENAPQTPLVERLKMIWSVTIERRTMYLHIYYVWIGIGIAFGWSRLPSFMPIYLVPWAMFMYGVGLFIGSMTLGKLFDQRGAMPLVLGNIVLIVITYGICFIVPAGTTLAECWPFFVSAFCLGGVESLLNVLCQSIILKYWEGPRVACSFSIFRVITGVTVSLGFFLLTFMATVPYMLMSLAILLAGCGSITYHELKVAPGIPASTVVLSPV